MEKLHIIEGNLRISEFSNCKIFSNGYFPMANGSAVDHCFSSISYFSLIKKAKFFNKHFTLFSNCLLKLDPQLCKNYV